MYLGLFPSKKGDQNRWNGPGKGQQLGSPWPRDMMMVPSSAYCRAVCFKCVLVMKEGGLFFWVNQMSGWFIFRAVSITGTDHSIFALATPTFAIKLQTY